MPTKNTAVPIQIISTAFFSDGFFIVRTAVISLTAEGETMGSELSSLTPLPCYDAAVRDLLGVRSRLADQRFEPACISFADAVSNPL